MPPVGPAARESGCDPGPLTLVDNPQVCRVQTSRQLAGHRVVLLPASKAKECVRPRGHVPGRLAEGRRSLVDLDRLGSPTGRGETRGPVEQPGDVGGHGL